ncbi:MarR family winged helix-turn-helix transcriptional regulator [Desnuesiella massiliensis]|uniref:MarR family winged helix-turn-helix transcriptional regulator n=1 Tax=Desnuesiella massiliensis TaxID=1650662 RepID=UPI0006E17284|nr:MarR family transcriptional regulator [Desnuesiella massiliensis]
MSNKLGGLLINKVNFLSGRVFTKLIRKNKLLHINNAQGRILFILSRFKEMSINELCNELSVSKSTLTSMLDRLYFNGYIIKKTSELDKRLTLISITEKAKESVNIYESIVYQMEKIYYKGFSEEDINKFENYLSRIYINLEEINELGED